MNLTNQPVYQKGKKLKSGREPRTGTKAGKLRMARVALLPCAVREHGGCGGRITVQHCGTGAGGRKDDMKTIPLCWEHHLGKEGIDGKRISKREWQEKYGTEAELLEKTNQLLKQG